MSQTHVIELPEAVYNALMQTAQRDGTTAAEVIAGYVTQRPQTQPATRPKPTQEEIEAANARLRQTMVDLGHASGADNDRIDTDLACEYGDDHAELYGKDTSA